MFNTLTQDRFAPSIFATERARPEDVAPSQDASHSPAQVESEEYEFVLGRRQVASLSFVVLVLISLFTGIAYTAGRSTVIGALAANKDAAKKESPSSPAAASSAPASSSQAVVSSATETVAAPQPAILAAGITAPAAPKPVSAPALAPALDASLFAEPTPGAIYVQAAALDRSLAAIVAEGLRAHGFHAFVASGAASGPAFGVASTPADKSYRVLMGPFPNIAASQTARVTLDQLGFNALPHPTRN